MSLIDFTYFKNEIYIGQLSSEDVKERLSFFIEKYQSKFINHVLGAYDLNTDTLGIKTNSEFLNALAAFVYYHYIRDNYIDTVGIGTAVSTVENGQIVKPTTKMFFAWNEMVDLIDNFILEVGESIDNPFEYQNTMEF